MAGVHLPVVTPGSNIGQYRIIRKIGAGGMGAVFLGEHMLLGRRAAIKTLLPSLSIHRDIVDRFFNEARATSAISDPGVVQIFDFGYHIDGTAYIVMEFLEGESLAARIERLGRLSAGTALRFAGQCAGSLAAAHERGIIHRDLKPENVFLIRDPEVRGGERPKILDFGICKLGVDGDKVVTQSGAMLGTPVYMSPEQCRGAGRVDHRSDIYALGCVLFHMLTGRPPFQGDGVGEYIAAHLREDPPAPSTYVAEIPLDVDALLLRCLAKSPGKRFQTMTEMQHAIEKVLARISSPGLPAVTAPVATTPLAIGFKSSYDGNVGTQVPTEDIPQFAITPMPGRATIDIVRSHRGLRAAMGILVVGGVAAALLAARVASDGNASDETVAPAPHVSEIHASAGARLRPLSAAARAPAVAPQPPSAQPAPSPVAAAKTPEPATPPPQIAEIERQPPQQLDEPAPQTKKATKPRPTPRRRATPPREARLSPPPTSTEDLYETR